MSDIVAEKTVSASDVEKYCYCPLSWWLSEQKAPEEGEELKKGARKHTAMGRDVKKIKHKESYSRQFERNILWFSLIAMFIGINGVAILYSIYAPSTQEYVITLILAIIAVLWVVVAVGFFYTGFKSEKRTKRRKARGPIIETEMEGEGHWKRRLKQAKWTTALFFFVSGILAMHGLIIMFNLGKFSSQILSAVFLIIALTWLIGSSFFYYISLKRGLTSKKDQGGRGTISSKRSFTDSEKSVILFAVVATVLASSSLTFYQNPNTLFGRIFIIISIIWLYGGFIFLYRALRANMRLKFVAGERLKEEKALVAGEIPMDSQLEHEIRKGGLDFERGVIWFAAVAMILALNAIIMNFSKDFEEIYGSIVARILEVVALVWLLGAVFFLYMVLRSSKVASILRKEYDIKEGSIEYVDADGSKADLLVSNKHGLRGKPDYVLKKDGKFVPVEVKTGRVPRGPLFSHIMQVAAYCVLIEENYDERPPFGIIRYKDTRNMESPMDARHEIDYTEDLRETLFSKLNGMKKIMESGKAHRNHNRPGKCRHCSRRGECPEKLV